MKTDMNDLSGKKSIDHPAPSIGLMTIMISATISFTAGIPWVLRLSPGEVPSWFVPVIVAILIGFIVILCLAFWLLYSTYYTLDKEGITVRYGPSTKTYRWDKFQTVYWRKGMFTTKIGWVSVTPCVRLSNAIALHRKSTFWPLYL